MINEQPEIPSEIRNCVRFDSNGAATNLGPMTDNGLSDLMSVWFDSGYCLFVDDMEDVMVLMPAWYLKNDEPVPEPLVQSMSMHLSMWDALRSRNDEDDEKPEWGDEPNWRGE